MVIRGGRSAFQRNLVSESIPEGLREARRRHVDLDYEKACLCPQGMPHSEICRGKQMKLLKKKALA
jgi:hypothetical protein